MREVYEFLRKAGTYYLATVDGDRPRVRPFGTVSFLFLVPPPKKTVPVFILHYFFAEIKPHHCEKSAVRTGKILSDFFQKLTENFLKVSENFQELTGFFTELPGPAAARTAPRDCAPSMFQGERPAAPTLRPQD